MIGHDRRLSPAERLADCGRLLVRRAILRDDEIAEAIFEIAANGKREWTPAEWDTLLTELKRTDMTVEEWLTYYS